MDIKDKLVTVEALGDAIQQSTAAVNTYTGSNNLIIHRVGRIAQIAAFPQVTTTSSSAVVGTIADSRFVPSSRVNVATKVFNGTTYVDCVVELTTNGNISIRRNDNAVIAGYQAQYTQCVGLQYLCNG